jgi:SAM-dependent methyltransferase
MNNMPEATEIEQARLGEANLAWSARGIWSLYEFVTPISFVQSLRATIQRLQVSSGSILDIGCGSGLALRENVDWIRAGGRVTAADPDPVALARVAARCRELAIVERVTLARCRAQDVGQLGLSAFDGAFAHFSLYTIQAEPERRAAVQAAFSVLKPGARFACAVPAEGYRRHELVADARRREAQRRDVGWLTRLRRQWVNYSVLKQANRVLDAQLDKGAMHRYSRDELIEHFAAAGFVDVTVQHIDGFNAYHAAGSRPSTGSLA